MAQRRSRWMARRLVAEQCWVVLKGRGINASAWGLLQSFIVTNGLFFVFSASSFLLDRPPPFSLPPLLAQCTFAFVYLSDRPYGSFRPLATCVCNSHSHG